MISRLTPVQAAIIGAYTGVLCGPFADFHAYVERIMRREVWTHELASPGFWAEIQIAARPDFEALAAIPEPEQRP